jgi:hypothetical protein
MIRLWNSIDIRWRLVAAVVIAAIVLPLVWYLGSPLFINVTVNERFPDVAPLSAPTSLPAVGTAPPAGAAPTVGSVLSVAPTALAPTPVATNMPAAPVALGSGQFTEVDTIHKGQGTATVYRLPDDRRVLRFEAFKVQNGPDLYVYLSGHPMPRSSAELHDQGAFEVARLKGNIGDQNYDLPSDFDLAKYRAVTIWCHRFSVNFATAPLTPAS